MLLNEVQSYAEEIKTRGTGGTLEEIVPDS